MPKTAIRVGTIHYFTNNTTKMIMKTKINFLGVIAVAAIMLSAGAGIAGAKNVQTATHYNAETDATKPADWQPITPGGVGSLNCTENEDRDCKAIQTGPNDFEVVQTGDYPDL